MEKLVETLGITRLSKSQVSVMAKELDAHGEDFRTRPFGPGPRRPRRSRLALLPTDPTNPCKGGPDTRKGGPHTRSTHRLKCCHRITW